MFVHIDDVAVCTTTDTDSSLGTLEHFFKTEKSSCPQLLKFVLDPPHALSDLPRLITLIDMIDITNLPQGTYNTPLSQRWSPLSIGLSSRYRRFQIPGLCCR